MRSQLPEATRTTAPSPPPPHPTLEVAGLAERCKVSAGAGEIRRAPTWLPRGERSAQGGGR